jgi:hypothetical protein
MGGCGGGSSQPTQSTVYNTNLPTYLQGPVSELAGRAMALTDIGKNPYQSYIGNAAAGGQGIQGTTVAGMTPMQQQAMRGMQGMDVSPQTQQASGMAGYVGANALDPGAYQSNIQNYMSPYIQNVINQQQNQAIADYSRSLPQLGSAAARVGGLGGSREALMESEANRNLQTQLQGITAAGLQSGYQNAQNAMQGQQQMGLGAAQALGQLGQQQYGQEMGILQGQNALGTQQQQLSQAVNNALNQNYQNYINYPYAQQAFLSGVLHGTSPGALGQQSTVSQYMSPGSTLGQAVGLGGGLASLFGNMGAGGV